MLTVIVTIMTITGRSICSVNSYCDCEITGRSICSVNITVIVTITGRSICSVNSYCDNNGEIYM